MARPTGPSSASKKDWRARPPQEQHSKVTRHFLRFFLSLVLVGLMVALVVLVLPGCLPDVRLVCLPVTDYDMTMPPVPFAARNVEEIRERLQGHGFEVSVWDDLQTSKNLASLTNRLQGIATTERTVLLLYVSAHGVSESGKAYLLCSDYQPRTNPEGRFEFGELLRQIASCRAKLKLLILDAASIATDARLGFVVNEFPRLAEAKVRETADPDLYVLMSHGPLQQSHGAYVAERSVFNYFVTEGLQGAANRTDPNDYVIDLAEFYEFVRNGVAARVARQTDDREAQVPILLRGGEGVCRQVPEKLSLVKVRPEPEPEPDAGEEKKGKDGGKEKGEKGESGEPPADKAGKPAAAADTASGAAKSDPKQDPPAESAPMVAGSDGKSASKANADASEDAAGPKSTKKAADGDEKSAPESKGKKATDSKGAAGAEKAAAKEEKAAAGKAKTEPGQEKAAGTKKAGAAAEPSPPESAERKPESPAAPAARGDSTESVAALLHRAWQQRDRMQARQGPNGWSPVDYAPHLWREYHELLLGFELRHRGGATFRKERLAALRDLAEGIPRGSGFGEAAILGRMESARREFFEDTQTVKRFEQARSEGLGEIEEAIKLRDDLLFAAPYYVRWHGRASLNSSAEIPLYRKIATLLDDDHLSKLARILESLERPLASDSAELQALLVDLRRTRQQLEELRTEIEEGASGLKRTAEDLIKNPMKRLANLHAIESLLAIPILSADLRARLIDRLATLEPPLELSPANQRSRPPGETVSTLRVWERYADQLRLEAALARLADPEFRLAMESSVVTAPQLAKSDGDVWDDYRKLGHALGEFYQAIPERIRRGYNAPQAADVQGAARLLRLVDARDVSGPWVEKAVAIAVHAPAPPPDLRIKLALPDKVTLDRSKAWAPIDVEVRVSGPCGDQARVRFEYEAGRIEVVDRDAKRPLTAGDPQTVRLDRTKTEQTILFHLNVRPKGEMSWRQAILSVQAMAEKKTAAAQVHLELPLPEVVDVVVDRVLDLASGAKVSAGRISGVGGGRQTSDEVACDAFPNRTTEYVVSLVNRSGKPKKVAVELWAPPPVTADPLAPLVGPLDRWGKPLPGYRRLASAADVELDASGTPLPIPFGETKAEPKQEGAEEPKKPAEKGEKKAPAAPEKPLVSRGLACVVYDMTKQEEKPPTWVRWLRFHPIAPRQYVQPSVRYDQGRITIQVKPLPVEFLPRLSEETPIKIDWDPGGVLDPNTRMATHAEILAPGQTRELFADVPPARGKEIPVQLAVDGYPRAFVFRVPTDRPLRIEELRDLRDVRISAPRPGDAFRIPLASPMSLEFQVDAPADAFRSRGPERPRDVIEVTMEVAGQRNFAMQDRLRFYSDRQFEARVSEIGTGGLLKVDAQVHDFRVPLNPGELKNAEVMIRVGMSVASAEGVTPAGVDVKTASVRVIFDAAKPTVKLIEAPRVAVPLGSDAAITVEAKDAGSGVAKIECLLRQGDSSEFDEKDKPLEVLPPNIFEQTRLTVPTKELKPGKYGILVRVTDKVGFSDTGRLGYLEIAEPPPPPKPKDMPEKPALSSIAGRAVLGSPDASITWIGLKVSIKELGRTVTAGADGNFSFPEVPQGQYTLEASGIGGNKIVKGTASVTVTGEPAKVDVPME